MTMTAREIFQRFASIPPRDCPWGCDGPHDDRCPAFHAAEHLKAIGTIEASAARVAAALSPAPAKNDAEAAKAMRERCAEVADEERALYVENAKACDRNGNPTGGTNDLCSAMACKRVAERIRTLPVPR